MAGFQPKRKYDEVVQLAAMRTDKLNYSGLNLNQYGVASP
ncbi:hypothetical protein HMPREF0602_0456 [Neisseria meningitidis ATCC 13091]|uniref:Uncharacterized protein n=1 Tax=Neisseria meningitidis serogroup B (strain ATCC 13091 / M2091) TaxID=862513 RepID=E0N7H6_NEIM3|nr:hypothetical protein HMPREF0602_0456 [Neisseria meningitidis ATCC 13091]